MNHLEKFFLKKDGITEKYPDYKELKSLLSWADEEIKEWNQFKKTVQNKLNSCKPS